MKVIDIHVHLYGKPGKDGAERFLEDYELEGMALFSEKTPGGGTCKLRENAETAAELGRQLPGRVFPFFRLDPANNEAPELLEWAVGEMGMFGCKMLPSNFNPQDSCAREVYAVAEKMGIPLLMHTGILWNRGNNADNCRPANMEVMWDYPALKFAMAHIGWPWTDECIAVAQKFLRMLPDEDRAFIDLTPGTPPSYRPEAIKRCLELVGPGSMLYGSDLELPMDPAGTGTAWNWKKDMEILERLGAGEEELRKIFHDNALRFIGLNERPAS